MNRQITLVARPVGYPKESDFKVVETPIPIPEDGQVLLKTIYLSVDPYMRGRMNQRRSYAPNVQFNEVMVGGVIAQVIESKYTDFQVGDIVNASIGWQEYGIAQGEGLRKIDPSIAPISTGAGILGMPGLTAYFGLLEVGKLQDNETVFVSGAAGAVGSVVGQIAKIKGCQVVGSAGSDEKITYIVDELGFDAAFNYKNVTDYHAKLAELCPDGIDVYFDNVGGRITDAVFPNLRVKGRVVICGQISQYNLENPETGPRFLWHLITQRARIEGFLVFDYADRHAEALVQMAEWLKQGKLKYRETIAAGGIENAPAAFISMLKGGNIGKQLVKIADLS
ncbi:NADP-dependent oxidoreductase [Candidatus Poribacteria bacterium]|nr:NADP-dependent oxidoreductase [Candidatus Poribacteria bacterium]